MWGRAGRKPGKRSSKTNRADQQPAKVLRTTTQKNLQLKGGGESDN